MEENKENCGCGPDCGCGHDHEAEFMFLQMEDGSEVKCEVIGVFPLDGIDYIVLLPEGEEDAFMYRYSETEDGQPVLDTIQSDEEYEKASKELDRLFAEAEENEDEEA